MFCEGTTEFNYFKYGFGIEAKDVGLQRVELVKHAQRCKPEQQYVWCVFDCDYDNQKSYEQLDQAIKLAEDNMFKVAYSNDSFELWFCLHYKDFTTDTQTLRNDYATELDKRFLKLEKRLYDKTDKNHLLKLHNDPDASQQKAIERAKKLHNHFLSTNLPYHRHNPCTTVYELVLFLNKPTV